MAEYTAPVFQIKITLRDSDPPIWRRVLVSSETKLSQLHCIIQRAMGWKNSHIHIFTVGTVNFAAEYEPGDLEELVAIDERHVKLFQLVARIRLPHYPFTFALEYLYDTGDRWQHDLLFEDVLDPDPSRKVPICIAGERACPPEDIGGITGYNNALEVIKDPNHPEHDAYSSFMGTGFDPEDFNLLVINSELRKPRC